MEDLRKCPDDCEYAEVQTDETIVLEYLEHLENVDELIDFMESDKVITFLTNE